MVKKVVKKAAQAEKPEKAEAEAPKKEEPKKEEAPKKKEAPKKEEAPKKAEAEGEKAEKGSNLQGTPEEQAKKRAEAVKEILHALKRPEVAKGRHCFLPDGYHMKYKPYLGPYKRFIASQTDTLTIHELGNGHWVVIKAGEKPPEASAAPAKEETWKKQLSTAWTSYCAVTATPDRSIENFASALPKPNGAKKAEGKKKPAEAAKAENGDAKKEDAKGTKRKAEAEGEVATKLKKKVKKKAA